MFEFNCPKCGMILEAEEEWRGMEVTCPKCNCDLTVPEVSAAKTTAPGRKKWLIPVGIGAGVLIAGAVSLIIFTGKTGDAPAVQTPVAAETPAAETVSQDTRPADEQIRELLRSENPDIKKLADLIAVSSHPMGFENSFLRVFDNALNQAADLPAKYQIFEAAGALEWESLNGRWQSFTGNLEQEFESAVREMRVDDIRTLRPLVQKVLPDNRYLAQSVAAEEAATLIARGDLAALRNFAENCNFPELKNRVENELRNRSSRQVANLFSMAQRMLSRGDIAGARSALAELQSIAPDDPRTANLANQLQQAESRSGNRPRHNAPTRNVPLEARLTRACRMGLQNEVIELMQAGADLHKMVTVSGNGSRRSMTVFMSLLEIAKGNGRSNTMTDNVKRCLGVILRNGFVPNDEEKAYIREHLPEFADLVK